ncbi:hypothetical protein Brsp02_04221 [Brucella sp. NBRC 113783]
MPSIRLPEVWSASDDVTGMPDHRTIDSLALGLFHPIQCEEMKEKAFRQLGCIARAGNRDHVVFITWLLEGGELASNSSPRPARY